MKEKPLTEFIGSKKAAKDHKEKPAEPKVVGLKGPWELPEGWRWVRLGEIASIGYGLSQPLPSKEDGTPLIRATDISRGKISLKKVMKVDVSKAPKTKKLIFLKEGDIIVVRSGAYTGDVGLVTKEITGSIAGYDLVVRSDQEIVVPKYLLYFLRTPHFHSIVMSQRMRSAQPHLNSKQLSRLEVPLPPLNEQKRIVAKLDEISKRLEEAKHLAREAREEAEKLMASALHEVFSKAEERGWEWVRLGDVVTRRNETIDPTQNSDLPFVGLEHITPGEVKLSKYSSTADLKSQKYVFYPGDVLYGKLRPYLDKAVVATIKGMCSTDLLVLTPKEVLMPEYLVTFMHTPQFRELATQHMRGTNHPRISWKSLQKFKIPLPLLEEQKHIVSYLDSISERAQRLVKLYEERERELEQLFPAILDRAFRGEV